MYIYIGENAHWDIYAPPLANHYTNFFFFFHFRCILLQISHKKCCFISISILGRSGVKAFVDHTAPMYLSELVKKKSSSTNTRSTNDDLLLVIPPLSKNCSNTFF